MNHLVIYCHPDPQSLNYRIKETVIASSIAAGHETRIRDIYAMNFNPVFASTDISRLNAGYLPTDILEERKHIEWAQLLTVIHPIWKNDVPAYLKAYLDKVLGLGFAYRYGNNGMEQLLKGKDMYIINTITEEQHHFDDEMLQSLSLMADNNYGFTGMRIVEHRFFSTSLAANIKTRESYLNSLQQLYPLKNNNQKQVNTLKQ